MADSLTGLGGAYLRVLVAALRYLMPILTTFLLYRCARPMLTFRREPEIWAWLCLEDGKKIPVTHWENVIGRNKQNDIVLDAPTVSRIHAVLTRYDDGSWTISDADSSGGITVGGKRTRIHEVESGDVIGIGGIQMQLQTISRKQEKRLAELRGGSTSLPGSILNLLVLTILQILCMAAFLMQAEPDGRHCLILGFSGIMAAQWILMILYMILRRTAFEMETLAFLLCTMGMAAIATVKPGEAYKQLVAMLLGIFVFLVMGWLLRDLERAKKIRMLAAIAGIGFLVITLIFGKEYYGAKNWLVIGGFSTQPSELTKLCFVLVGASTMDRLVKKRNLILFIGYSVAICGCLALMNDLGTAIVFFCAFLVIAYMRSGSVGTIGLACTALGFAGVVVLKIAPHALRRLSTWRHVWETATDAGYQQAKGLMCIASGGIFGLGAGQGWMKHVFASDSDVVVATLGEEWGLLAIVLLILCIAVLGLFAVRSAAVGRSSFYTICACTAASILLMQTILNALGTLDVLPLTGITFPFLSNGGSSMISSWGLLAFLKAADTRQNASFAVKLHKSKGDADE